MCVFQNDPVVANDLLDSFTTAKGAGAASIVGMELNDDPKFDVQVIGFGCPALLSKELSEQTKSYITTIVADDDCVPRMSAASVVNALLDIMEYDYTPL